MNKQNTSSGRILAIGLVHILFLSGVCAWAAYRGNVLASQRALPPLLEVPLSIEPLYDYDTVVTGEQLVRVLRRVRPELHGDETKINHIDHALRFWGVDAKFADKKYVSGEGIRQILTNYGRFTEIYGAGAEPLMFAHGDGIRVRVKSNLQSSTHVDHTMASLAEVGTPLGFPIITPTRQATFREVIEQARDDFSLNQQEYEWSALTFALYAPTTESWFTSEGQRISFDQLAVRIMREELPSGVCFANHRLYTLTVFLRVDDQQQILSPEIRAEVMGYLQQATALLVQHQHSSGFWTEAWPYSTPKTLLPSEVIGDRLSDRILATGHALEWWATAPESLHPPRHVLASAGQWLVHTIEELTDEQIRANYTYLPICPTLAAP